MIAARIQANQRGRARAYHAERYQRWWSVVATKVPHNIFAGGGVLTIPGDAPASPPATTTLNTHAILLGASSLTSAAVRRWVFMYLYKKFLPVLPTGLWTLVAGAAGEPVVPPGMLQTTKEG